MRNILPFLLVLTSLGLKAQVAQFDATSTAMEVVSNNNLSPTATFSIEAWVNIPANTTESYFIYDRIESNDGFGLFTTADGFSKISINGGQGSVQGDVNVYDGEWHHLAGTYDKTAGEIKIYIDGTLSNTASYSGDITYEMGPRNHIGGTGSVSSPRYFEGYIDELRIWSDVRSLEEIFTNKCQELNGDEEGLIAYWDFNGIVNDTIQDQSASDNDVKANGLSLVAVEADYLSCCTSFETYIDTVIYNDTMIHRDTIIDTLIYNDTIEVFDTTFVMDTLIHIDTVIFNDTLTHIDTVEVMDTITHIHVVSIWDSASVAYFDESNTYMEVLDTNGLNPLDSFSVEVWVKIADSTTEKMIIYDRVEKNDGFGILTTEDGFPRVTVNGGQGVVTADMSIYDGEWHHIAGTYDKDAKALKLFIDGVLNNEVEYDGEITYEYGPRNHIGGKGSSTSPMYFHGHMEELRIWSSVRTQNEIFNHKCLELEGTEEGLISYWDFNEEINDTMYDQASGMNHVKVNGIPLMMVENDFMHCCEEFVRIEDTVIINDTIVILDTNVVDVFDTVIINDTNIVDVYDSVVVLDTQIVEVDVYDTVTIYDSVLVTDTLYIDLNTNIEAISVESDVKLYPNPAKTFITVDFEDFFMYTDYQMTFINQLGQEVYSLDLDQFIQTVTIDEIGSTGIYYIYVKDGNGMIQSLKRLVIE